MGYIFITPTVAKVVREQLEAAYQEAYGVRKAPDKFKIYDAGTPGERDVADLYKRTLAACNVTLDALENAKVATNTGRTMENTDNYEIDLSALRKIENQISK